MGKTGEPDAAGRNCSSRRLFMPAAKEDVQMGKVVVVDHPLVQHKHSLLRDKKCGTKNFRHLIEEIGMLMAYEVTRDLPLKEIEIETPVAPCKTHVLAGKKLGIVPILRAGLGMVDGVTNLVPAA